MNIKRPFKSKYYKIYETARFYGARSLSLYADKVSIRRLKRFEKAFCKQLEDLSSWANGIEENCIEARLLKNTKLILQWS